MSQRGLLVDYGGVLTASVGSSFRAFEREEGLPKGTILALLQAAYEADQDHNPIAQYERGEIERDTFEEALVAALARHGHAVRRDRIVARLFAGMAPAGRIWDLVDAARTAGVRTGLLSNSWGVETYPRERLAVFDAVVISGEVGLRKPDPEIYRHAAERLDLDPGAIAFVDDLDRNVEAARRVGMFGVLHRDDDETVAVVSRFLGLAAVDATAGARTPRHAE